jgi:histone H3/H4
MAAKKPQEMLLVASKTKQVLKDAGCNVSGDALDSLNELMHWYLEQAAKRAEANGRKTVRGHDFSIMN